MNKIDFDKLLELAKRYKSENIHWHHHFLTPRCILNDSNKFKIILENENTQEAFFSVFDNKPMDKLVKLENLFFNRTPK